MPAKTIYIKPGREELYEKAVRLCNADSLSAILEEAVENLVKEKEGYFRWVLLVATLERTPTPCIFQELLGGFRESISDRHPELKCKADHALDVLSHLGFFDKEDGIWHGPKAGMGSAGGFDAQLWYRGIMDDLDWLDELHEMAVGPAFAEYERQYEEALKTDLHKLLPEKDFERVCQGLDRKKKGVG